MRVGFTPKSRLKPSRSSPWVTVGIFSQRPVFHLPLVEGGRPKRTCALRNNLDSQFVELSETVGTWTCKDEGKSFLAN